MLIPHITRIFVPETAVTGDLDRLETASLDGKSCVIGPPGRYNVLGYLVPVNQLEQFGIAELVASPAAMIIGLSTHERAALLPHEGGVWELRLQTGRGKPETYAFRDHPEPRQAPAASRRKQAVW